MSNINELGQYLKQVRKEQKLSLRQVESETKVSNAYLSQLEGNKIRQPSPNILHNLCEFYGISYLYVSELAGYPVASRESAHAVETSASRFSDITKSEEEALADYLEFLRTKKHR